MTQDEIIEMARQVGVDMSLGEHWSFFIEELEAFAKLVDAKATAREREACAKTCEKLKFSDWGPSIEAKRQRDLCAEAIRARGEA